MIGVKTSSKKDKSNTKNKVCNHTKFIQGYVFRMVCNHTKYIPLYVCIMVCTHANHILLYVWSKV